MILSFLVWPIFRARWWLKKKTFSLLPGGRWTHFDLRLFFQMGWLKPPTARGVLWEPQASNHPPDLRQPEQLGSGQCDPWNSWCRSSGAFDAQGWKTHGGGAGFPQEIGVGFFGMGFFFPIQGQGLGKKLGKMEVWYGFRMFCVDGYSFLWRIWVGLLVLKERNYRRFLNSQPWWRKGATTLDRISSHDWKYVYVKRWNIWIRVYFKVSKNCRSGSNSVQCCWAPDLVFKCVLPCPKWQMFGCKM